MQQDVSDGHIKAFRTQRQGAHRLIWYITCESSHFYDLGLYEATSIYFSLIFWPFGAETAFPDEITVSTADEITTRMFPVALWEGPAAKIYATRLSVPVKHHMYYS